MINRNNFWCKNLLLVAVLIFVHLLVVSSASGQMKPKRVKGVFDMPFDTSFFGDEPNDESKAKALKQAKVEAWKKYLSLNLSPTRMTMYMKVKKQILENLDDYVMNLRLSGFKVKKEENTVLVKYKANINGMNALHQGIEMDCAYKLNEKITLIACRIKFIGLCGFKRCATTGGSAQRSASGLGRANSDLPQRFAERHSWRLKHA